MQSRMWIVKRIYGDSGGQESNGRSNLERGYVETTESQSEAIKAEAFDEDALAEQQLIIEYQLSFR